MAGKVRSMKITKRVVDSIEPTDADFYVFDNEVIGFGLRVRKTGGVSYIVRYRAGTGRGAPVRRVTISPVGKVTPDQAREKAKDILASVVKGGDPARERSDEKKALTFSGLSDLFLAHIAAKRKPTTAEQYRQLLYRHAIPTLGNRRAASLTTADIATVHSSMNAKPMSANRLRAIISSMYSWAMSSKTIAKLENPAADVVRYREKKRERYLTTDEIGRLAAAILEAETVGISWEPDPAKKTKHAPKPQNRLVRIDAPVAAAFRLLLLTGARLREILHLKWGYVDFERGLLLLPD